MYKIVLCLVLAFSFLSAQPLQHSSPADENLETEYEDWSGTGEVDEDVIIDEEGDTTDDESVTD